MALFKLYKTNKGKVLYRRDGSGSSVRFSVAEFAGNPPAEIEIPGEFATATRASKVPMPEDVAAAAEKVRQFRAAQKAEREARLTPEQRAKREQKRAEKAAAKAAKTPATPAAKASPATAVAPGRQPKVAGR